MPAVHVFVLGADAVGWPDRFGAEIVFHRLGPGGPGAARVVRREAAGGPFALAADGAAIAPALGLAAALLPAGRAAHLFLSGEPDGVVVAPGGDPPIPVTYLAAGAVPAALSGLRPLTVRPIPSADPGPAALYAVREQLGSMDPGDHVWA
ncbi:hypothetical protein Ssi03_22130 [Sphaerisporangium siamense]|uniref:Uncharacterized protein n=1 Tax=Sphaerisporangium siamense TaxID=795645 RepID=A0A7W7D8A3_9ACTN|nr:hypothetical protein [Sphaerisporangium siamense]MBB4701869.1 hypothetical protein [Sphaerisporangium siamense]GII84223.1 hypothetical protein Ssi03_22130 [Sphaerisporangium siamense]